ncbi:MAG: UDP-3-O-(3-hydroxymyristoyl)glucosamine N-acyltransferase [candidate division Zixibacteria bacterium RBG_16_40_9]|nr:MAG: UDP-3-O-(3-hydroxymyristoyl)glucosamine N-acyltransferase [candidate division Zixibacteria bacterium RBG_16_40_9]
MQAFVDKTAQVGENSKIGLGSVIAERVKIGKNCQIGNQVVIHAESEIGDGVRIDDHSVIGKLPLRAKQSKTTSEKKLSPAKIGENCLIGTSAVIYAGATLGKAVLVADLATVREEVTIGDFTIVGRGVAVENQCKIGSYCKLETNAYITAYSELEDYVFISPGVVTSNDNFVGRTKERVKFYKGVTVKKGGRVGANATVLPGKVIAEDTLVAAGATVTKNTPAKKVVMGTPAKVVRDVPKEQLLENQ